MLTGRASAAPETVHCTRNGGPPLSATPVHWVTVALVVEAFGVHDSVGPLGLTPPWPDDEPHWSTVTPVVPVPTGTLLTTVTLHITLFPAPVTMLLHWSTEETSEPEVLTLVVVGPQ